MLEVSGVEGRLRPDMLVGFGYIGFLASWLGRHHPLKAIGASAALAAVAVGATHLLVAGHGLEGPVHSTLRSANDRGYECLLLSDCTGATDPGNYRAALEMVKMQGGVFGAVAPSSALLASLKA